MKRSVIISDKYDIYKLPHKLQNNLRFTILWTLEISEKAQHSIEL